MRVIQKKPINGAASDYSRFAFVWMTYQLWTQTWANGNSKTRLNVVSPPDTHTRCVIVLHHNSPPHDYFTARNALDYICWRWLDHLPYSPRLSPFDFHVFDPLKKAPMGRILRPEEYAAEAKRCEQFICVYFPSQYNTMVVNPIRTRLRSWDILVFFLSHVFTVSTRRRKIQKPVLFRLPRLHRS
jgi:hypothetical protein